MLLLCFYFEGYLIGTSGAALGFFRWLDAARYQHHGQLPPGCSLFLAPRNLNLGNRSNMAASVPDRPEDNLTSVLSLRERPPPLLISWADVILIYIPPKTTEKPFLLKSKNQNQPPNQPDSIYRNSNFITVKHTSFKLNRNPFVFVFFNCSVFWSRDKPLILTTFMCVRKRELKGESKVCVYKRSLWVNTKIRCRIIIFIIYQPWNFSPEVFIYRPNLS